MTNENDENQSTHWTYVFFFFNHMPSLVDSISTFQNIGLSVSLQYLHFRLIFKKVSWLITSQYTRSIRVWIIVWFIEMIRFLILFLCLSCTSVFCVAYQTDGSVSSVFSSLRRTDNSGLLDTVPNTNGRVNLKKKKLNFRRKDLPLFQSG